MIFGAAPLPFSIPPELRGQVFVGDFIYPRYRLVIFGVALAAVAATWFLVYRTAFGRVVRAGVQNPDMVGALGISLQPYMTAVAALGLGLAGLAGVLLAPISGVHPAMGAEILTAAFVVVVIGGLGSFWGVIAAAALVGVVRGVTIYFNPSWGEASMYLPDGARPAAAAARAARRAHPEIRVDRCGGITRLSLIAALALAVLPFALDPRRPAAALVHRRGRVRHRLPRPQRARRLYRPRLLRPWRLVRARRLCGGAVAAALVRRQHRAAGAVRDPLHRRRRRRSLGALILRRRGVYFSLLTLALTALLFAIAYRWTDFTGGESGLGGVTRATVLGVDLERGRHLLLASSPPSASSSCFLLWRFHRSPVGHVLVAIRENEQRARFVGYPTNRYKLLGFVISATRRRHRRRAVGLQPPLRLGRAARRRLLGRADRHGGDRRHAQLPRAGARRAVLHPVPRVPVDLDAALAVLFRPPVRRLHHVLADRPRRRRAAPHRAVPQNGRSRRPPWPAARCPTSRCRPSSSRPTTCDGAILEARGIAKSFGALKAVQGVDIARARPHPARPDRPERRRQDHRLQPDLRPLHAGRGRRRPARPLDRRALAGSASPKPASAAPSRSPTCFRP